MLALPSSPGIARPAFVVNISAYKVSVAIMGHLRTLQYYYSKEASHLL